MSIRLAIIAVALILSGCGDQAAGSAPPGVPGRDARGMAWFTCDQPTPATPAGYQRLWDTIPTDEWGAGDVSLSVRMGPRRRVWLYGDTLSDGGRIVHSSGITQLDGCVHVSRQGAQLLPDIDATHIFWIHDAWKVRARDNLIRIKARAVELTGEGGPFGFRDGGYFRKATVRVEPSGDLTFLRWGRQWATPEPYTGALIDLGGDDQGAHFGYLVKHHMRLPNGWRLMTMSQNWEGPLRGGWDNYRPIFYDEQDR